MHETDIPLLLVDDDAGFRSVYRRLLSQEGYAVTEAHDAEEAKRVFGEHGARLALVDLMLPPSGRPEEGAALCEHLLAASPRLKIVVVSGTGETELPLSVVQRGAYDFITKPVDPDVLVHVLSRARARLALEDEVEALQSSITESRMAEDGPLGVSKPMIEAKTMAERAAPTDIPVLITGETGTGKEVFARYVHRQSRRRTGPFIAINCGAIPETLLESALFGHIKGAFTGAIKDSKGFFLEADGGTLFLDEIGDMPLALQVKLLRALEAGEVTPVGASQPRSVDVRILSATHRPLDPAGSQGTFREDLYYRIRGIEIALPRLCERSGDLEILARYFLHAARDLVPSAIQPKLSADALRLLESHDWPGNLRELRTELSRAVVMASGRAELLSEDFSPGLRTQKRVARDPTPTTSDAPIPLEEKIAELERNEIRLALEATGGNKSQAANRLGLSRQGLLNKMARHGIG